MEYSSTYGVSGGDEVGIRKSERGEFDKHVKRSSSSSKRKCENSEYEKL